MTDTKKDAVERLALFGTEGGAFMAPAKDGRYVFFRDYDVLAQQCADLEAKNASLTGQAAIHHKMIRMVAADVEKYNRRANRAESERDAIAAAMVEAAAKLAEQYWGAGHHADQIRALTPADALAELDQIRAEERAVAWRAAADICRVSPQEEAEGGWRSEGMQMARELRSAILAAMEKEQGK